MFWFKTSALFLKNLKWGASLIKAILIQIHRPLVWFQVSCIRQHNEWIIDLFPAPNIYHLFIKFDQKFLIFLGEALYQISRPIPSKYIKKMLWIIIVIVYKTKEQNRGFRPKFLGQTLTYTSFFFYPKQRF